MKIPFLLFFSSILTFTSFSQVSHGGKPYSFNHPNFNRINEVIISPPSEKEIHNRSNNDKSGYCVGKIIPISLNPSNSGTWITHVDGSESWLLKIKSPNAIGLTLNYKYFTLPNGAEVFLYNENKNHIVGKFTSSRNNTNPITHTQIVQGETTIIEYHKPANTTGLFNLEIESVVYIFRGFEDYLDPYSAVKNSRAEYCQIDVACSPENNGWSEQIDAVVHFSYPDGGWTYVCSGSVINNTDQDCSPYILTAWHCGEHSVNQNLSGYTWYWNYQKSNCAPNSNQSNPWKGNQTMINGSVKSTSGSGTLNNPPNSSMYQVAGSDFTLVELGTNIPSSYGAYYSGWDRGTSLKSSGVSIHHPNGSAKKISTFTTYLLSETYNGGAYNAHWEVFWSSTTNGHGVTEPGSSGAPIFDQNKRIVGQLSGGNSYCGNNPDSDLYGKFSSNWSSNGNNNNCQLAPWLDPTGSNTTTLDGTYYPCPGPNLTCNATSNLNNIIAGNSINFYGNSNISSSLWDWNFDPNNLGGVSQSTSSIQNPSGIVFNNPGTYDILLTVTYSGVSCTSNLTITVNQNTTEINENLKTLLKLYPNPSLGSLTIDFSNVEIESEYINLFDQAGRIVKSFQIGNKTDFKEKIELTNLESGVYFIKSQKNLFNNKIIILSN
jgi:hypothetical protein